LTCLSTTIVHALAKRRIPCVFTLHDYWLICHRGQLLDVDYRVCDGPESGPCHTCLGDAGGASAPSFLGATALRGINRWLPAARHLRRLSGRIATFVASPGAADEQARRRLEHMRTVCADVTHFVAPSRHMRDRFVQFGVAADRITVAGYGFNHTLFPRVERVPSTRLRIGFLGSLMVSKGPHVLLEAVARLPPGAVSVDLFGAYTAYHGDDRYRRPLESLLKQDGVRAHGTIGHDQVGQALASVDILVVPSIWPENSPLVIQEAFLAGVPVVASRIGGIPEVVDDGRDGLLFRAGDAEDLARVLTRLLREPELLETLRAGIPRVRTIEDDIRFSRRLYQAHLRPADAGRIDVMPPGRVAAVVLHHRTPDDTFLAVRSLLASRRAIEHIIVVDNDHTDTSAAVRTVLAPGRPQITYLHTGSNLGYSGGMNFGVREALAQGADRVLLLNSDVIVPPDCLLHLEQSFTRVPAAGIAGPVVLARSEPDHVASLGMSYASGSGRMRHHAFGAAVAELELPAAREVDGVSGCLMLVKREVFEAVGLLDTDYFFSFEDLDFCLKARRAGFSTVLAGAAAVYHEGGRSIGATSPRRLYFAARNHLLLARRNDPSAGRFASLCRGCSIVLLNLAHAVRSSGGSLPVRLAAVVRGTRDYAGGRFGADPAAGE
jgi:GT2 family glycosyltransferase/glycosyltransferase involved in cell wall biosynthesis